MQEQISEVIDENGSVMKKDVLTDLEIIPGKSGLPTLKMNQILVHSQYDPVKEANQWVKSVEYKINDTIVVLGLGLGYHVQALLDNTPESVNILIVEPVEEIGNICKNSEYCGKILNYERVRLICNANLTKIEEELKHTFGREASSDRIVLAEQPGCVRTDPTLYTKLRKLIVKTVEWLRIQENTTLHFSFDWSRNIMENLWETFFSVGVAALQNSFQDVPAIVVSAGPSLSKNVQKLHAAKDKALIICVGTALRVLLKEEIRPDLIVTIDGGETNAKHFEGIDYQDIPIVFYPTVHPKILKNSNMKNFVSMSGMVVENWLNPYLEAKGYLSTGGSVANSAFDFAYQMGCNPIALIGQDLAYSNGESHAKGTTQSDSPQSYVSKQTFLVEDLFGGQVMTDKVLNMYRIWFENYIRLHPDRTYINATEGGAKIEGTQVMSLEEFIEENATKLLPIKEKLDSKRRRTEPLDTEELESAIDEAIKRLDLLKREAGRGERLARALLNEYTKRHPDETRVQKIVKRLDKIDATLKREQESHHLITLLLQPFLLPVTRGTDAVEETSETENQKGQRVARLSIRLYESFHFVCSEVVKMMTGALENSPSRRQQHESESLSKL